MAGLSEALLQGMQAGKGLGGKQAGLQAALARLAESLKSRSEGKAALNLLGAQEAIKAQYQSPKDKAQADYYSAIAESIRGGGISPILGTDQSSRMSQFGIPEEEAEDYILRPKMVTNRGVAKSVMFPEKKEQLSEKTVESLKDVQTSIYGIEENLKTLEENPEIKKFLGPGLVQRPGAVADIAAQLGMAPKNFATFKASTDIAFQKYRKWVTGIQAGLKELNWIAVDYPKTTDTAENYISKSNKAIKDMQYNMDLYLDYLSKSNYATSQYKSIKKSKPGLDFSNMSDEELMAITGGE